MITAFRGQYDIKTNENRNTSLVSDIRTAGFGFVMVTGYYVENPGTKKERRVKEQSFLVISNGNDSGRLKAFLKTAGEKFDQDSVLYKDSSSDDAILIGTASGRWPGMNTEVKAGKWKPNAIGTYYTQMRGHRTFTFESVEVPEGLMSRAYRQKIQEGNS
jgi:hypothetical protein